MNRGKGEEEGERALGEKKKMEKGKDRLRKRRV